MKLWEEFEDYLFDCDLSGQEFNHAAVMEDLGVDGKEATALIQAYLDAQHRAKSNTLFVLRRVTGTRTKNAMWHVGARSKDARALSKQWTNDAKRRIERAIAPDMARIGTKNPRAVPSVQAALKGIEASLDMMAAVLGEAQE